MKNFEDINRAQKAMELGQKMARGIGSLLFNWKEKGTPSERLAAYRHLRLLIADMFDKNLKSIKYKDEQDGQIRRLDFYKTVMIIDKQSSSDQESTRAREYLRGYVTEQQFKAAKRNKDFILNIILAQILMKQKVLHGTFLRLN